MRKDIFQEGGNMNTKRRRIIITLSLVILIFIGFFMLSNTNNNPNPIIQRIFRPIHFGTGAVFYAVLIPILLIYYSLKGIHKQNNHKFLSTRFRRIIILMVILYIIPTCSQSGTKLYKSFYSNLNSIYCYRDTMKLSLSTTENQRQVVCRLDLENCSSKTEGFSVKVHLPSYFEVKEHTLKNTNTSFTLNAKERRQIEITFSEDRVMSGSFAFSDTKDFGFSLYNGLQEVKFTQTDTY
jgi:hypothetical protein